MCGIFFAAGEPKETNVFFSDFQKMANRGPDHSGFTIDRFNHPEANAVFAVGFHRLAINDLSHKGNQPFFGDDGSYVICNGEIYNFEHLKSRYLSKTELLSESDCEVLLPLYRRFGIDFVELLEGEFSFILFDKQKQEVIAARDTVGVRPLYYAGDKLENLRLSSELKGLTYSQVKHFPPGHIAVWGANSLVWKKFECLNEKSLEKCTDSEEIATAKLKIAIEHAVKSRMVSDVPIGCLLSGGIDSSGVAAVCNNFSNIAIPTFTLRIDGLPNEDAEYARIVAEHLGSAHHEIVTTLPEIFSLIDEVIYISETYNFEMVPNLILLYLVAKYVKENTDIKVLLDGTGPDELLGGYWFFRDAPSPEDFESETVKQVREMHRTELLGDRVFSHFGIEMRYPYLDRNVVKQIIQLPSAYKFHKEYGMEKKILRSALEQYLPVNVAWRKKLGMTHGAGNKFENIFDQEIRRRLGRKTDHEAHERIVGIEDYYKNVFFKRFPLAQLVECNVTASRWREHDPIAIWR